MKGTVNSQVSAGLRYVSVRAWKEYFGVFVCGLCVATGASSFSWMEPLVLRSENELGLSESEISWVISSVNFGAMALTIPVGYFADWYGRKPVLLSSGPILLLGWVALLFSKSVYALYLVRFLQGSALAIIFAIMPLYIAEITEANVRGMMTGQFQTMWSLGLLFSYVTGPYMELQTYIYVCTIPPLLFTFLFVHVPETPYYLLMNDQEKEASETLKWLRGTTFVESELKKMKESVAKDMENKVSLKEVFATGKDRKIFLTVQMLYIVKYMIGSPAMSVYASEAFSHSGAIDEHYAAIIFGCLLFSSAVCGALLSDSVGRRPILICTTFLIGVSYAFSAGYYYLKEHTDNDVRSYEWVMYLTIGLSTVLLNIGPGSILQTIQGELFPTNTRAMGGALTGVTGAVVSFINIKQYQTVKEYFGVYFNFVIFSSFAFLGSLMFFIVIKETAGKSLGEIQADLEFENNEKNPSASNPGLRSYDKCCINGQSTHL